MGVRNRRWQTKRYHDDPSNPRPPRPPYAGYNQANNQCPVPLWEREFCSYVGGISWQKFCENNQSAYMYIYILSNGMIPEPLRISRRQSQDSGLIIMPNHLIYLYLTLICTLRRLTTAARLILSW